MDQFLLKNATLYQDLVEKFDAPLVLREIKTAAEIARSNMVVSARIRPLTEEDVAAGFPCALFPRSSRPGMVDAHELYNHPKGRPILKSFDYEVDKLFNSQTTTEEIYEDLVVPLIPCAWNGGIGTLFTYGQTGSGKTFTASRLEELVADTLMNGPLQGKREVHVTIIDLAGKSAFDLLNSREPISILEDSSGNTQLVGAVEKLVQDRDDMIDLIDRATSFRRTAPTFKNDTSSRSHCICRIRIKDPANSEDGILYMIDLAGSEGARDIAQHGPERMRETREINVSLSVLKDCIRGKVEADALVISSTSKAKQKKPHLPIRQSILTKILKHVFEPVGSQPCKTVVIACLNPSLADIGPSKNTLKYAEMLRVLLPTTGKTAKDLMAPTSWTNAQVRKWIDENSPETPKLSGASIAPIESGLQLLNLSAFEFEYRCRKCPGVSIGQAKTLRLRLWQMHNDFQHRTYTSSSLAPKSADVTKDDKPKPQE